MTLCVISQPRFFPGFHYLHRMMVADLFVVLDSVQFTPRHEENRAKLKSPSGPRWLTVPTCKISREQRILDTRIDDSQPWRSKATKTLYHLYGKAAHYAQYAPEVNDILETPCETLVQLDWASWGPALRLLGINCQFVYASTLPIASTGSTLLLDICAQVGADTYLSGAFGRQYLDSADFLDRGVDIKYHAYTYPVYPQRFGDFVPYLSYLDMLFNAGLDREKVLAGGTLLSE